MAIHDQEVQGNIYGKYHKYHHWSDKINTRNDIIREEHESSVAGYKGVTKTYQRIRQYYY
jgi:hypothetical protein